MVGVRREREKGMVERSTNHGVVPWRKAKGDDEKLKSTATTHGKCREAGWYGRVEECQTNVRRHLPFRPATPSVFLYERFCSPCRARPVS